MIDVLWAATPATPDASPDASPATGSRLAARPHDSAAVRKVIAAVRAGTAGTAGRLFPPVLRLADDGLLVHDRFLAGDGDADVLAAALASPRFARVVAVLDALDAWCGHATNRYGTLLSPGLLDVTDGALFGPLVAEAFTACAAGAPYAADEQHTHWTTFLDRFLERASRDVTGPWFDRPALRPPLTGIEAQGGETHNGRARILRVSLSGGGVVAYKPRPADGELLFLAPEDSVFALLNSLPPVTGPVVLPVLRCTAGSGPDRRDYTWQEWIEPPSQWGPIRSAPGRRLDGTRLGRRRAELLWHRAGSLAAAAFRFGIADLAEGNILAGTRPDQPEPLLYPVDLEIFLAPLPRLHDTGLVADTEAGDHHHPGLEDQPRWCTLDGPVAHFTELPDGELPDGELPDGGLRLVRRRRPCARGRTRTVVADTLGRTGYGPYLPEFLRGMFDAWTLMSRHHDAIRSFLVRAGRERHVRVLLKPTAAYTEVLADRLTTTTPGPADTVFGADFGPDVGPDFGPDVGPDFGSDFGQVFGPEETAQLDALDAPYFFRSVQGGPLLRTGPGPVPVPVPVPGDPHPDWPPSATVRDDRGRDLAGLGVALRDAVEYVYDTVGPGDLHGDGVHVRLTDRHTGEVAFDQPRAGRRIVYTWDRDTTRIRSEPRARPAPALDVRRRLLAIDRVDAELRARWTDSGFGDEETGERLRALTAAAVRWLEDVVRRHGWPGRALVGPAAAAAACRLLQHAEGPADFQHACLGLIEQAARDGDLPWRQVAYVTDALRVREGRPQLYGTKFRMREGKLEPCPIEQPEQVDERRRRLRMEPLARYAGRLHRRYQPHTG